jgi:hypothetical protein
MADALKQLEIDLNAKHEFDVAEKIANLSKQHEEHIAAKQKVD